MGSNTKRVAVVNKNKKWSEKMKKILTLSLVSMVAISLSSKDIGKYDFDYEISPDIIKNISVSVPSPDYSTIASKSSQNVVDHFKYMPIFKKARYEYEYESTNFTGKKKVIVEFKGYSEKDALASASITYFNKKDAKTIEYSIKITEKGILATDSILGNERIEIPIPLFKDKRWTENGNENRVIGFSSKIQTPYSNFDNALKILTNVSNSEAGKIERYYAENIGLVKEVIKIEDKTDILTLVNYTEIK